MLLAHRHSSKLQAEQASGRATSSARPQQQFGRGRRGCEVRPQAAPGTSTPPAPETGSRSGRPDRLNGKLHGLLLALGSAYTPLARDPVASPGAFDRVASKGSAWEHQEQTVQLAREPPGKRTGAAPRPQRQQRQAVHLVQLASPSSSERRHWVKDKVKKLRQEQQEQMKQRQQQGKGAEGAGAPKRAKAGPGPTLPSSPSDASLTRIIASAASSAELVSLFKQQQQRMNFIHTSVMMRRLSSLVASTASHRQVMSSEEGRLWVRLRDKALMTRASAQLRHVVDILAAVHSIAASREQQHLGWVRAVPVGATGATASGEASAPAASDPTARRRRQQQFDVPEAADVTQEPVADPIEAASPQLEAATAVADQTGDDLALGSGAAEEAAGAAPDAGQEVGDAAGSLEPSEPGSCSRNVWYNRRPLHSSCVLLAYEKDLIHALLQHSLSFLAAAPDPAALHELIALGSVVGRLGFATGPVWQAAFFAAATPHLPRLDRGQLVALSVAVGRLQPVRLPPPAWLMGFYRRSQALMDSLNAQELSVVITCASRLPAPHPEGWVDRVVQRCTDCMDSLDAPAFALVLHALGRMRQRSLRPWIQELLESSTNLLYDFSPEELSLVLRGCTMLRVSPDSEWFIEFFTQSQGFLRLCSGPQLANIGWSLALMRCMPPRQWIHEWISQLQKRLHAGGRPLGVSRESWHGIGYAAHAKRAVVAIAAFRGAELEDWCTWLRTPLPRQKARVSPPAAASPPARSDAALGPLM